MKNDYLLRGTYLLVLSGVLILFISMGIFGQHNIVGVIGVAAILAAIIGVVYGGMGFFGKDAPESDGKKPEGEKPADEKPDDTKPEDENHEDGKTNG